MAELVVTMTAKVNDVDDINTVLWNANEDYSEYSFTNTYEITGDTVKFIFTGEIDETDTELVARTIKFTHHGEGFYADTTLEYVHITVQIGDKIFD